MKLVNEAGDRIDEWHGALHPVSGERACNLGNEKLRWLIA